MVATLPASLLANAVAGATNDTVVLAEAEGTIWNGSAITVLTGGVGSRDASVLPTRLEWRLRPRWNGVALHLTQDCCLAHGVDLSVRRSLDAWQVKVVGPGEQEAPVARLKARLARAAPTPRAGRRHAAGPVADGLARRPRLSVEHDPSRRRADADHAQSAFSLQGGHWRTLGSAQVEIRQASSRLTTLDTLGTYRVLIQPDPSTQIKPGDGASRALVWISTLDGALLIDGRGLIGATGVRIRAEAHAAAGSEAALNNLLNLIGRRNGASSAISIG